MTEFLDNLLAVIWSLRGVLVFIVCVTGVLLLIARDRPDFSSRYGMDENLNDFYGEEEW
jgi:hypothetical protein